MGSLLAVLAGLLNWLAALCVITCSNLPRVSARGANEGDAQLRLKQNKAAYNTPWLSGMAPLPEAHAPSSPEWRNSVAVCAVMKDENVDDVAEWLAYYRWLGVEHVFLTDNGSRTYSKIRERLWAMFPPTFLTLRSEQTKRAQLKVYAWCAETQRANFNWLAFFDLDEYLVFTAAPDPADPPKIGDFLDEFKDEAGVSVNWIWVGPSGRKKRPAGGGVLRAYDQCVLETPGDIKTIANTWFLQGITLHPHNCVFRGGHFSVAEDHEPLSQPGWKHKPWLDDCDFIYSTPMCTDEGALPPEQRSPKFDKCCQAMAPSANSGSVERVALFHYATKSWEDFEAKMKRGSGMSTYQKDISYFTDIERDQQRAPMCERAAKTWEHCCSPEALARA